MSYQYKKLENEQFKKWLLKSKAIGMNENDYSFRTKTSYISDKDGILCEYISIELVKYFGNDKIIIIPPVDRISTGAFKCNKSIEEVIINHENIKEIENEAFNNCKELKKVIINSPIKEISRATFSECIKLKNIKLPETLDEIGVYAFNNCESLENIELPNKITTIRHGAFLNAGLKEISIPESLADIGLYVFCGCIDLEKLSIYTKKEIYLKLVDETNTELKEINCTKENLHNIKDKIPHKILKNIKINLINNIEDTEK